jgi:hypothetical protein
MVLLLLQSGRIGGSASLAHLVNRVTTRNEHARHNTQSTSASKQEKHTRVTTRKVHARHRMVLLLLQSGRIGGAASLAHLVNRVTTRKVHARHNT